MTTPVLDKLLNAMLLHDHGAFPPVVDTRANLLATTPDGDGQIGFTTDYLEAFIAYNSGWYLHPFRLILDPAAPDMGADWLENSRIGYGIDYITDKRLSNVSVGSNATTETGALRLNLDNSPPTLEMYDGTSWGVYVAFDLSNNDLRHTLLGYAIKVWRGDSVALGLNGRPLVQEYQISMGAYPVPLVIDGGSF